MAEQQTSRNVNAREAVEAIRGELSNVELMERFKISAKGFADLLTQLFENKLISEEDLASRGIRFRVVKKEATAEPIPGPTPKPTPKLKPLKTPQPFEHDEEFLDTVELTEMLSFKPGEIAPPPKKIEPPPPPPQANEEKPAPAKKGKFRLSNLFKKDK